MSRRVQPRRRSSAGFARAILQFLGEASEGRSEAPEGAGEAPSE